VPGLHFGHGQYNTRVQMVGNQRFQPRTMIERAGGQRPRRSFLECAVGIMPASSRSGMDREQRGHANIRCSTRLLRLQCRRATMTLQPAENERNSSTSTCHGAERECSRLISGGRWKPFGCFSGPSVPVINGRVADNSRRESR